MEKVKVEIKATSTTTKFKSFDGQIFETETDCKCYESHLRPVMWKRIVSVGKQLSEYDFGMPFGCDAYCFRLIKITKDNIADLNNLISLFGSYRKVEEKDIDEIGVFDTNECDYESFSFCGTTKELLERVTENLTM